MEQVKISSKFQIVIPSKFRKAINAKPRQEFWITNENGFILLIPKIDMKALKGALPNIDTSIERDDEDRLTA